MLLWCGLNNMEDGACGVRVKLNEKGFFFLHLNFYDSFFKARCLNSEL